MSGHVWSAGKVDGEEGGWESEEETGFDAGHSTNGAGVWLRRDIVFLGEEKNVWRSE